jgi:hypothetical protein
MNPSARVANELATIFSACAFIYDATTKLSDRREWRIARSGNVQIVCHRRSQSGSAVRLHLLDTPIQALWVL